MDPLPYTGPAVEWRCRECRRWRTIHREPTIPVICPYCRTENGPEPVEPMESKPC